MRKKLNVRAAEMCTRGMTMLTAAALGQAGRQALHVYIVSSKPSQRALEVEHFGIIVRGTCIHGRSSRRSKLFCFLLNNKNENDHLA